MWGGVGGHQLVQVRDFYANWEAFATARLFSSADKYDTRAAPNRQVRRAMETAATHVLYRCDPYCRLMYTDCDPYCRLMYADCDPYCIPTPLSSI